MVNRKFHITSRSVSDTQNLGQKLGARIRRPLVIALTGGLGSGKTAFVQGLACGLEVPAEYYITSPTFTLINEYPGRYPLVHVDLYRLENIHDFEDLGLDDLRYDQAVMAIEWADRLSDGLPAEYLALTMEIIDADCRKLSLVASGQSEINLIKALAESLCATTSTPDG